MGRYYYGDIEGKFAFGIQSSDAADRFGVKGVEPNYIEYWFTSDDLEEVQKELKSIQTVMGDKLQKIEDFFKSVDRYTDEMIADMFEVDVRTARYYLNEYFDFKLGKKIEQQIIKEGECSFTAEL